MLNYTSVKKTHSFKYMNRYFDGCRITYGFTHEIQLMGNVCVDFTYGLVSVSITYGLVFVNITYELLFVGITYGLQ